MKHFVISLGCEYGCGGPEIGRILSNKFDIAYYDRVLIDQIMEEAGFSKDITEKAEAGVEVKGKDIDRTNAGNLYSNMTPRMVYIQSEIIKKLADRSSCIFIGRCADYFLKDRDDCLNVFIYTSEDKRVKNVMKENKLSEEDARYLIRKNDSQLHLRYEQITGTYRGDRNNRDLLIDSSKLGYEYTAKIIADIVTELFIK